MRPKKKPRTICTGLNLLADNYFFLAAAGAAAGAAFAAAGAAALVAAGAAASSCFNWRVITTDATEIRGELRISMFSATIS